MIDAYLARIGVPAPRLDLEGLGELVVAHQCTVPFENLDVWAGRQVSCDPDRAISKIVADHRGGWCFELNGAFALLLEALGFTVERHAATVLLGDAAPIPDHLTLVVTLERPYLVDVGFGAGTPRRPVPLDEAGPHDGGNAAFRLTEVAGAPVLERRRRRDGTWERCFRLEGATTPEALEPSAEYLRSTENAFTAAPFATRALDAFEGRVTWSSGRLVLRRPGVELVAPMPRREGMRRWFGIDDPYPECEPGSPTDVADR